MACRSQLTHRPGTSALLLPIHRSVQAPLLRGQCAVAVPLPQWLPTPFRGDLCQVKGMFGKNEVELDAALEEAEQTYLRSTAKAQRFFSSVAFWLQLALSVTSATILLFSVAFIPQAAGSAASKDVSKYFTLVGVACSFLSTFFAHGFKTLANKLLNEKTVRKGWIVANLLRNNGINLFGIGVTVVGLQASVGTLVAKTLLTSVQTPYSTSSSSSLVSLDVFSLQASTNVLLCHIISLVFTNLMLRIVNKDLPKPPPAEPEAAPVPTI